MSSVQETGGPAKKRPKTALFFPGTQCRFHPHIHSLSALQMVQTMALTISQAKASKE